MGVEMSWKWGGGEKSEEEWRGVGRSGEELEVGRRDE